ncbi:hypothetical protein V1517DRAFT_331346 [Lipomyces orientalis]|uniref:Uncharacterized protein n=1 Tax=Lipomyces orientalis TaxID=1233043 RepID=A0ACC3TFZ5_9ASCO
MLNDAASRQGEFLDLDPDISLTVSVGLKKYQKYYRGISRRDSYWSPEGHTASEVSANNSSAVCVARGTCRQNAKH